MNIFTKIIISTCVLSLYTVQAQNDGIKILNLPTTINNNYLFDGYWGISNDDKTTNFKISGTKLTNNSTKTSENLFLDLYLVPADEELDLSKLPNKIKTNARLGKLEPNGTSFNNIVITIKNSDIENYDLNNLIPVLVLLDRDTNNVLNYRVLNNSVNITFEKEFVAGGEFNGSKLNLPTAKTDLVPTKASAIPKIDNNIASNSLAKNANANSSAKKTNDMIANSGQKISTNSDQKTITNSNTDSKKSDIIPQAKQSLAKNDSMGDTSSDMSSKQDMSKSTDSDINVFNPIPSATPENGVLNPYVTVESSLEVNNTHKALRITGVWKLDIDFEKMLISITGDQNAIQNYSFRKSNKLRLMLYFSKEDLNVNIVNGYDFASFEVDPIEGAYKLDELEFYDNITKLVPAGEYFPLLVLKEFNSDKGEYVIRTAIRVGEKVRFY